MGIEVLCLYDKNGDSMHIWKAETAAEKREAQKQLRCTGKWVLETVYEKVESTSGRESITMEVYSKNRQSLFRDSRGK